MGGDLKFFGVLARPKEPFVSVFSPGCNLGGGPFLLDGRDVGGGD